MTGKRHRIAYCLLLLFTVTFFTACTNEGETAETVIEMEMTSGYDESDPFIHEKLFYLPEDTDALELQASFEMKGETGLLEIADNETKEIYWSENWNGDTEKTEFTIKPDGLQTGREYVIRFTGTQIEYAKVTVTADARLVKEREKPARSK